ncbi:hypothetical protein GJ496_001081 [Pomphorhynchus laevis]|nr:hypothetical protein GJ496_001081 [Pomphorhynchus laevis]
MSNAYHELAVEFDSEAENHRLFSNSLNDDIVKPIKTILESYAKKRKAMESGMEIMTKSYHDKQNIDFKGTQQLVQCRSTEFGQSMTMKRETDQIDLIRSTNKSNAQTRRATNKPQSSCTRCGRQHTRFQRCPATGKTCRRCENIGHFEACCRSTNTPTHNNVRAVEMVTDNYSEILRSINTIGHDDIIPIIKVQINGQCINMEFDTGASVSIISRAVWQHIGEPTLHPAKVLKTYGGQVLQAIGKCLGIPKVAAYLDDTIITGKTSNEHLDNLQKVLERLKQAGVKVKREKCSFLQERVKFLGHVLTKDCIQACPNKLEALQKMPTPTNKGELRSFLGGGKLFEPVYSKYAIQLQKSHTQAFEKVKKSLMDARILKNFDIHKDVHLTCDASDNGLGAILFQEDSNHVKLPVAYASRTLKPNEKDYAQVEKEGLAIVFARIVIPRSILYKALETLHLGHQGISAMRHLAGLYCWWHTINTDIEQWVDRCLFCQKQQPKSAHQPLHQWDVPA